MAAGDRVNPVYCSGGNLRCSGSVAGPSITVPAGANRLPWQGQSQLDSMLFQCTLHFMWVQTGETANSAPLGSLYAASVSFSNSTIAPSPDMSCDNGIVFRSVT